MLFQPGILALTLASLLSTGFLLLAAVFAVRVVRFWDLESGSARQMRLEKQTYLVSTIVGLVMMVEILSLVLFVYNADRMAVMFVGAMCPVGTLNVNPFGFPTLLLRIGLFFLATTWLFLNHLDAQGRDYPLIRPKHALLLGLVPWAVLTTGVQTIYFLNLDAHVITSCCSRMFNPEVEGVAGELSGLPPLPTLVAFYVGSGVTAAVLLRHGARPRGWSGVLAGAVSGGQFALALTAIISAVASYIYDHPRHHSPFTMLTADYQYVGYALYLPLFAATALGLAAAVLTPALRHGSLATAAPRLLRRLSWTAAGLFLVFGVMVTVAILTSRLILIGGLF